MTIKIEERPRQKSILDPKRPTSTREYYAHGSDEKVEIQLAAIAYIPIFDTQADAVTGLPITLFRGPLDIQEAGGGTWSIVCPFESSQNTVDLNFSFGVQSVNIKQSLRTVRSYSCITAVSANTQNLANLAITHGNDAVSALEDAGEVATDVAVDKVAAETAANGAGVDATIKIDVLTTAAASASVIAAFQAFNAALGLANSDSLNAANAAAQGDADDAETAATNAQDNVDDAIVALTNLAAANTAVNDANDTTQADYGAVVGPSAETTAAAEASQTLSDDVDDLYTLCVTAKDAAQLAATAARAAADAVAADQVPGGNGVPDFKGAIGVNGDQIEGCEIEVGKLEFSITKKWALGTLSGAYLQLLGEWTDRCRVNNNDFTFAWQGQTLTFRKGTLRFRCATVKWNNSNELEITYHFAYSRSIRKQDNFRIGQSALITKQGWEYLWTRYRAAVSGGITVAEPQSAYVEQVYPEDDFTKLQL